MDNFEKIAYICLAIVACVYVAVMLIGMIVAFPYGILGLLMIIGFGLLFVKVIKERMRNKEDDYYSKNVDK